MVTKLPTKFLLSNLVAISLASIVLSCAPKRPVTFDAGDRFVGHASWYGGKFQGRQTASGEIYDKNGYTAAHRTAPFGSRVRVTNLSNGKSAIVRINDRGPFVRGRIIDLSLSAARDIDMIKTGTARVRLEFLERAVLDDGRFFIQLGSFREYANAQRLRQEALSRFPSQPSKIAHEGSLHKVWLGPLATEEKASLLSRELSASGFDVLILRR